MLVDVTQVFDYDQIHQRPGNFSKKYIPVDNPTYDLLKALEPLDRVTHEEVPFAQNQLLSVCAMEFDPCPIDSDPVHEYRDFYKEIHAEGIKRKHELVREHNRNLDDTDTCEKLREEIANIEIPHAFERSHIVKTAGLARCGDYGDVLRFHAYTDPRMSALNAEICVLSLKDAIGDHDIVSVRDPRIHAAKKIPFSDAWCPLGSIGILSERFLHSRETDWKVTSNTDAIGPSPAFTYESLHEKIKSGDYLLGFRPRMSDDRKMELIDGDPLFNRIAAVKDCSVVYVNESAQQLRLSYSPLKTVQLLQLGIGRRDELLGKKLNQIDANQLSRNGYIETVRDLRHKYTAVV
jgi:hypothetical protein